MRGLVLGIGLQDGKATVGLVVVVGMALEVNQKPVRRLLVGVPAVARQDMFIFAIVQIAAGQPVVFDVIGQLELPDRGEGLDKEKAKPDPAAQGQRKGKHGHLKHGIAPERV